MKRIVMSMTLAIVGLIVPGLAFADEENDCSVATLFGEYLFTGRADSPEHKVGFPRVFAGVYTFDGEGSMSGVATQSFGGEIEAKRVVTAKYTLESDCTGTITFPATPPRAPQPQHFAIYISRDGNDGNFVRVDDGAIATRTIARQARTTNKHR